ncbi:hypothetical protein A4G20_06325 [Pasteurellaceae bacterium RH1A]|nr:hypothetical protein A4G20_06325 [Pasteurellaceae bacterium RH1A]
MAKKPITKRSFHQDLVLNQWALSLFNQADLAAFKTRLGDCEGIDPHTGHSHFFLALNQQLFHTDLISQQDLSRYDFNIVQHWAKITHGRNQESGHILALKYFQYLSLLFTEIYLDWYFNQKDRLLAALNQQLGENQAKEGLALPPYTEQDLNKIAFWNATGSGKTLLMHVNILQFQHYAAPHQKEKLQIYLLTPNDGLSLQHIEEFQASNMEAALFDKNGSLDYADIKVIDIHKLADKSGDKTVAVEAFADGNKLILVDEGHRGAKGEEWLKRREQMIGSGFAFEYSATFGQAVGTYKKANRLYETYAKAILFDYSYKYFYRDGYGKEHLILNMKAEYYDQHAQTYFWACLLAFYQQRYLFEKNRENLTAYNLENPLWVFVGNTVNKEDSDILQVLHLLNDFLKPENKPAILAWFRALLEDSAQLLDKQGKSIFLHRFRALAEWKKDLEGLYQDVLKRVFQADFLQHLTLVNVKKSPGELALKVGEQVFGVINVGDDAALFKQAGEQGLATQNDEFSERLFEKINKKESSINLLIGSRKFSEGWSSWRVSTMGLLNMGRSEGAQIIQLFGRGVRLKGRDFSLKRSNYAEKEVRALHLRELETLNIFGIKADYMAEFQKYIQEELEQEAVLTLDFPVKHQIPPGLKTLRLKEEYRGLRAKAFKRVQPLNLYEMPPEYEGKIKPRNLLAVLDAYPRVEAISSQTSVSTKQDQRLEGKIPSHILPLFNWDRIYLALWQFKQQEGYYNLRLDRDKLRHFVEHSQDWYQLYIPPESLVVNQVSKLVALENLLIELLKIYTQRFYNKVKQLYESQHYEVVEVDEHNLSLLNSYQFRFTDEDSLVKIEQLKTLVEQGDLEQVRRWTDDQNQLIAFTIKEHLYYPLFLQDSAKGEQLPFTLTPIALKEKSEFDFLQDLQKADLKQLLPNKSLYLMRNAGNRAKGLGFASADNFYPDFLVWIVDHQSGKQWLTFIDPKGIGRMGKSDPKFQLHQELEKLQAQLGPDLILNSFILAITKRSDLDDWAEDEFAEKHILFMTDEDYLNQLFHQILEKTL